MAGKIRNLNDLAKQVGCTATAVSMALHDSPQLSEELREKIKKTAKENDFVPRSYNRRTVRVKKRYSHLGPLLLLHNDFFNERNPKFSKEKFASRGIVGHRMSATHGADKNHQR